jgi:hypothetical protein
MIEGLRNVPVRKLIRALERDGFVYRRDRAPIIPKVDAVFCAVRAVFGNDGRGVLEQTDP